MCIAMHAHIKAVTSLSTLVQDLKKSDLNHLWALTKNVLFLVQIMLCLMPTSISAERSFSVLDRVKTKLRNSMGDERMSNLSILATCPDVVGNMDVTPLCNKFVCETSYTGKRLTLFGNFVSSDLEQKASKSIENEKLETVDEPPQLKVASV